MMGHVTHYLRELYRYWMRFAHILGEVNFTVIFSLLFFILIGPYALVSKLMGKRQTGGWVEKKYTKPSVELLERQF